MVERSVLEGYLNEFQNTVESARSNLDRWVGLSATVYDPYLEMFAVQVPNEIADDDLWVQLRHHVVEMQKLMCLTGTHIQSYGEQVNNYALQILAENPKHSYVRQVSYYSYGIISYGLTGISCGCAIIDSTHQVQVDLEEHKAKLERSRDKLNKCRVKVVKARAKLNQQHHQGALPQTQLMLLIPHEEILDDGVIMIRRFLSLIVDAGFDPSSLLCGIYPSSVFV